MSNALVSFLLAAGAGTWIYTKFMRYTGNNTKNAVVGAGVAAVIIFFIFYSILSLIIK